MLDVAVDSQEDLIPWVSKIREATQTHGPTSADKPMQLNQASFTLRGGSGYVPQPDIMREDTFDPFEDRLQSSYSLNPVWVQEQFAFDIHNPTFSFLGVTVYEQLIFHTSHLNCTTRTSSSSSDSRIWIRIMILERFGRLHGFISK